MSRLTVCPACASSSLSTLDTETYDADGPWFVGEQSCDECGASMIYRRRLTHEEAQTMAKTKKPKSSKKGNPNKAGSRYQRARSVALPGLEDLRIPALDAIASEYASIRDQRIALNQDEHALKQNTLKLMKKYGKTLYHHDGIRIAVVAGEDDVKVSVKAVKPIDTDPPSDAETQVLEDGDTVDLVESSDDGPHVEG